MRLNSEPIRACLDGMQRLRNERSISIDPRIDRTFRVFTLDAVVVVMLFRNQLLLSDAPSVRCELPK